jgi:hypothetical protein
MLVHAMNGNRFGSLMVSAGGRAALLFLATLLVSGCHTRALTCRAYSFDAIIDGQVETVYGRACLQPDGSWRPLV